MNRDEQPQENEPQTPPVAKNNDETLETRPLGMTEPVPQTSAPTPFQPAGVPQQPDTMPVGGMPAPQPKRRPKWFIPAIIAGVLVVLGGSSALAYNFWYQNPQKVISDGLMHALQAKSFTYKATANVKADTGAFTIAVTGISKDGANSADASVDMTIDNKPYKINGSLVVDNKSNIYVKVANVDRLLADFEMQFPANARAVIGDFIKKINDQWIVISNDRIKTFSDAYAKMQKCSQDAVKKLQQDKSYSTEVTDLYKAHPFMKIAKELGSKDGSLGYEVAEDEAAGKAFAEGLKNTKIYKMMHDCDDSFTVDSSDTSESTDNAKVEIWVSRWSHEITKATMNQTEDGNTTSLVFEPVFNTDKSVTTPKNAKSVDELMQDLQDLQAALFQASMEAQMSQGAASDSLFS
jgi:hypothetical protein